MAISVQTPGVGKIGWIINGTSADASGCEELIAAPAAGTSIYVDYLVISSGAAITITIGAGETGGAVTTALIGPVTFAANTSLVFPMPAGGMKVGAATSLTVDASGAGAVNVWGYGRIE